MKKLVALLKQKRGQTVIILLLIMVVALTIGLTLASRAILEKKTSTSVEQSERAYAAAEAGVEEALSRDLPSLLGGGSTGQFGTGGEYSYTVTGADSPVYEPNKRVAQDDVIQLDLASYTGDGITICWVSNDAADQADPASLEITIIYGNAPGYGIEKWAYNATARTNGFTDASLSACSLSGVLTPQEHTFSHGITINPSSSPAFPASPKLVRIKPLYNGTYIVVASQPGGPALPAQVFTIRSEGTAGDVTRTVEVERSFATLPAIFDHVLFNGNTAQALGD